MKAKKQSVIYLVPEYWNERISWDSIYTDSRQFADVVWILSLIFRTLRVLTKVNKKLKNRSS